MSGAIIGINPTQITAATATAQFRLGTRGGYDHPTNGYQEFIYGRANGAVTGLGYLCVEQVGFDFAMASLTSTAPGASGFGTRCGAAQAAMADNEFGWFQVYGKGSLRLLGATAIGTRLNSSATDGALDDAGTAGSEAIFGVVINVLTSGDATSSAAVFNYPSVGTTL